MRSLIICLACFLLIGCPASESRLPPVIEFTKTPKAAEGGPDKTEDIEGRVKNAARGQKIVLYAKSGIWWVQPFADKPLTDIEADSTWKTTTHYGTEYAALLVGDDFQPIAKLDQLPEAGGKIAAVAVVSGSENKEEISKNIQFSGYEWKVRTTSSDRGGTVNSFHSENVRVDENGFLHLRIRKKDDAWSCAEVSLTRSLGYGTYNFVVGDTAQLEPSAVLSMFTWDDLEAGQNHREIDIEITRWGEPENKNMQYVIQPYYVPANVARFNLPAGLITNSIRWEQGRADFKTFPGKDAARPAPVAAHLFTSGIPASEGENVHISFYVFGYGKIPLQKETEIVIEKFEFLP
jgi:hypothetical protein